MFYPLNYGDTLRRWKLEVRSSKVNIDPQSKPSSHRGGSRGSGDNRIRRLLRAFKLRLTEMHEAIYCSTRSQTCRMDVAAARLRRKRRRPQLSWAIWSGRLGSAAAMQLPLIVRELRGPREPRKSANRALNLSNGVSGEGIPSRLKPVLGEKWSNQVQEQPPVPLKRWKKLKSTRPGE